MKHEKSSTDFYLRYKEKISISKKGCWIWTGFCNARGYGVIRRNNKLIFAHRLSYLLMIGKVPKGLELDHLCRIKSCCNPKHLEAVTHRENVLRGDRMKRKSHCLRGHKRISSNLYRNGECKACKLISSALRYETLKKKINSLNHFRWET